MADRPSLLLGSMELYDPDGVDFGCEVLAEGTSRGVVVPITEAIESFLEQGAIEVTQGWESREVPIRVTFSSTDFLDGLALAEAALISELNKPNTLTWTPWHPELPGDHLGTPVVFDVINSWLEPVDDDLAEVRQGRVESTYQIRLVCRTFVHAVETTTVAAAGGVAAPTINSVSTASSATGWSATWDGGSVTPTLVSGTVEVAQSVGVSPTGTIYRATLAPPSSVYSIDVTTDRYLVVDFFLSSAATGLNSMFVTVNGSSDIGPIGFYATSTPGQYRAIFDTDSAGAVSSITALTMTARLSKIGPSTATVGWRVDAIGKTSAIPNPGGERELLRSFAVNGTAPSDGGLFISHASSAIGDLVLYTAPDKGTGYNPAGRTYRTGGGSVSSDGTALSGSSEPMDASPTFDYPATSLEDGEYLVMVRCKRTSGSATRTVTWTVTPRVNSIDVDTAETRTTTLTVGTSFEFHRLGMIHLPPMTLPSLASAVVRLVIDDSATGTTLDNVYVYNMTTGVLSQLALGTGTAAAGGPSRNLWIDPPNVENEGRGELVRGHATDRSDAFSAYPVAVEPGQHVFDPRWPTLVSTLATNPSTAVSVELSYKAAGLTRLLSDW